MGRERNLWTKHSVVALRAKHCLFLNGHIKSSEGKISGMGNKVSLIKMRKIGKIDRMGLNRECKENWWNQ